jgi:hypothetical protein
VGVSEVGSGEWEAGCGRLRPVVRGTVRDDDPLALFRGGQAALYLGDESSGRRFYRGRWDCSARWGPSACSRPLSTGLRSPRRSQVGSPTEQHEDNDHADDSEDDLYLHTRDPTRVSVRGRVQR